MFKKIMFENGYAYTADEEKNFIGKVSNSNPFYADIIQSNGKTIRAFYGIMFREGMFYVPCTNTACGITCFGNPPYNFFCVQNPALLSMAAYYVKID